MDSMNERQKSVLRMLVGDYIKTARPVGSAWLVKRHKMGCCSATVRNDMSFLEQLGFIGQSHFSAGRVPTAAGYRYYIDNLMTTREIPSRFRRRVVLMLKSLDAKKYSRVARTLAAEIASVTGNLTMISMPPDRLEMSGMQYFLCRPEFRDEKLMRRTGLLLDRIGELVFDLRGKLPENSFRVYIDEELNYEFMREMAVVVRKFRDPFGESHVLGMVGPVRMDYSILPDIMDFAATTLEGF